LVPKFLVERFPDIATSLRTAERLIGEFKTAKAIPLTLSVSAVDSA
jgi:hypothetical protein